MSKQAKTVRVRIAVAVDRDGDWIAAGNGGNNDNESSAEAREGFDDWGQPATLYWLEADLPIPEQRTVEAAVTLEAR